MRKDAEKYLSLGYHCEFFEFQGRSGVMVCPKEKQTEKVKEKQKGKRKEKQKEKPWIWRTEFFGCFDYADFALLEQGWHVVYVRMSDWYGAPEIINFMEGFYTYAVHTLLLDPKADLFGFSRGGLYAVNFAVRNPERVRTLYLDAPVIDLASWPGGFYGTAPHLSKEWGEACAAYQMKEEELKKYGEGLLEKFEVLYKNRIPILLVAGMEDLVVPYEENGALLERFMIQKGSRCFHTVKKPRCGHHPHSLESPEEIVEFIIRMGKYSNGTR